MVASIDDKNLGELRQNLNSVTPIGMQAWTAAKRRFVPLQFDKHGYLLRTGEIVTNLFFLTDGLVRFYYADTQGREFNRSFAGPGQVLSSMASLSEGAPSPFSVQALAPTRCFVMRYVDHLELATHYPEWSRLRVLQLERLIIKQELREADLLLLSAKERYLKFLQEYAVLAETIPNYHIASYLGITERERFPIPFPQFPRMRLRR
jgi:CRP-like cAMP-binding protein